MASFLDRSPSFTFCSAAFALAAPHFEFEKLHFRLRRLNVICNVAYTNEKVTSGRRSGHDYISFRSSAALTKRALQQTWLERFQGIREHYNWRCA
ncbi:MAG: hypothetical protein AUH28_05000 [Acidobacteria bacterium 13_1_40CM_56_16]|nr:MAG: hypothetical protein AUH28_05000 [Acidobacteria bacterium 13_1_40CM_56_16]OLD71721.1 MAG: hypothetical protein AUI45_00880 [Acidobacteria bacterium 13_1_40CM_2_56_11]